MNNSRSRSTIFSSFAMALKNERGASSRGRGGEGNSVTTLRRLLLPSSAKWERRFKREIFEIYLPIYESMPVRVRKKQDHSG